jgi:hypothetical protein
MAKGKKTGDFWETHPPNTKRKRAVYLYRRSDKLKDCHGGTNGTTKTSQHGCAKSKTSRRKNKRTYVLCFFQVAFWGLWLCK